LITAFKATLEEVKESDCICHVIDITSPQCERHIEAVENILNEIGAGDIPILKVFNKIDLLPQDKKPLLSGSDPHNPKAYVSAKTGEGLENLKDSLHSVLYKDQKIFYLSIPKSKKEIIHSFTKWSIVLKRRESKNCFELKIMANPKHLLNYLPYIKRGEENW
jgi:GTP-binding protein HflX